MLHATLRVIQPIAVDRGAGTVRVAKVKGRATYGTVARREVRSADTEGNDQT